MRTTQQDTRDRVLATIKRFYFVNELWIAEHLGITILDALDALLELERTDADVIIKDGVIGFIGNCDRIG
jgi:hypothetical protein